MAINPSIALGVKSLELPAQQNQLAQYAQMQSVQNNAMQMQEMQRSVQEKNALRNLDPSASDYEQQLFRVDPKLGIAYRKESADAASKTATTNKANFELVSAQRKFGEDLKRGLSSDPSDQNITMFGQEALRRGIYTLEQVQATVSQLMAIPMEERVRILSQAGASASDLKPSVQSVNQGGQTQLVRVPAFGGAPTSAGTYADVPLPADVQAQKMRFANASAPKTTIAIGGNKYAENVGGDMGKSDVETFKFAQTIPAALAKVDETLGILRNSDINTGLGAEILTTLDRAKSKFAADKSAGIRVSNTEYLNALIGSEVFPLIQSLGIGARGMDTPAEREFLREVMTGTIGLDKNTLIRLAELRKKAMIGSAEQYNKNVDSGELDRFFDASGRSKSKIQIPKPSTASAPASNRIPGQGATPQISAQRAAPVFAVNPSTGQRIQSIDGGNTWTPVGGQ